MEETTHEIVTQLSPTMAALMAFGVTIGIPTLNKLLEFLSNRFSSEDANERALITRLLDIIDAKFDKLAESIMQLAEETRATRIAHSGHHKDNHTQLPKKNA